MLPHALIKDTDYAESLNKLGFCVVPLFTVAQLEQMRELYHQNAIDNKVSGLIASHSKSTGDQSRNVSSSIKDIVMPALQEAFEDFSFFMAGFMVKEGNTPGELPLHQDWNIVDESRFNSYQIWVPLDLSHAENGGMYVLPGSHQFFNNFRSGSYGIPNIDTDEPLRPFITDMIIPPGSALVFHNSLFHASYPNHSSANRISAIVSICSKDAGIKYYHRNEVANCTDVYTITSDIFLRNLNRLENKGLPEEFLKHEIMPLQQLDNSKISSADLIAGFKNHFGDIESFEPLQLHILKDGELEKKLKKEGYAVLDLLDGSTVAELKEKYINQFGAPHTAIGRFTPMEHATPADKRKIHDFILDRIRPALDRHFKDYQTPIASYFTKYANSTGDLSWHTDASLLLNTHIEPHYGIWCPLVDVSPKNGALCIIERSHKFSHVVFLNGLAWPYDAYTDVFEKKKKVFTLKAGQVVLFDMRLVHHATPNETDEDRICFAVRFTHKKSKFYSFRCEDEDKSIVSVYEETPNFYLSDDWSGANQVGTHNRIGKMKDIYAVINYGRIESALMANEPVAG